MNKLLVSISCLTYNHAPYIKQTIDGFLMQKTNFDFEILIHDDASNDGTAKIIQEYESKYPNLIKPIYQKENQWSKGRKGSAVFNFPRAKGKYIAMCEGDDYWTDPLKLQKQVDFLEENEDIIACGTQFNQLKNDILIKTKPTTNTRFFNHYDVISGYKISTLTTLFRNNFIIPNYFNKCNFGDLSLYLYITKNKKEIALLPINTAVYRIHKGGIYSGENLTTNISKSFSDRILFFANNKKHFNYFYYCVLFFLKTGLLNLRGSILSKPNSDIRIFFLSIKMIFIMIYKYLKVKTR